MGLGPKFTKLLGGSRHLRFLLNDTITISFNMFKNVYTVMQTKCRHILIWIRENSRVHFKFAQSLRAKI